MYNLNRLLLRLCTLFVVYQGAFAQPLVFDSQSSTIKVDSGATLTVPVSGVPNFNGTLIKSAGGTITGGLVSFVDGILEDSGNFDIRMTALFNPTGTISLAGNSTLLAESGKLLDSVTVSGSNNVLKGQPRFSSPLTLTDAHTTLTLAIQSTMNQNIIMNGGTLALENDLTFNDAMKPTGTATFNGGGHAIILGGVPATYTDSFLFLPNTNLQFYNCEADLSATWTFQGPNYINGQGNVLDLSLGGQIFVQNGTLELQDVTVKGISQNSFLFGSPSATINMCGANLDFISSVTFNQGTILVDSPSQWIIKNNTVDFAGTSTLTVNGVTLWKDRAGSSTIGNVAGNTSLVNTAAIKEACVTPCTPDLTSLVSALMTSTGFLQSEIDTILSLIACCQIDFLSSLAIADNDVLSTDWNFNTSLAAAGLNNNLGGATTTLRIYSFNGLTLTQTAATSPSASNAPVSCVRWHPSQNLLAVSRRADPTGLLYTGGVYMYSVSAGGVPTLVSSVLNTGLPSDVRAVAWDPTGNYLAVTTFNPTILGVAGNYAIQVYSVNQITGAMTLAASVNLTGSLGLVLASGPNVGALDWVTSNGNNYIAFGTAPLAGLLGGDSIGVYQFTAPGTLTLDSSAAVPAIQGAGLGASSATAVNWNDSKTNVLAVGLNISGVALNQPIQIWDHTPGAPSTLTYRSGVASSTANVTVNDVDFSPNGNCLVAAATAVMGAPLTTYDFDKLGETLTLVTSFGSTTTATVNTSRWDPSGSFVIDGTAALILGVITPANIEVFGAVCSIGGGSSACCSSLQSSIDQLRTSTGFLQSEIDACCAGLQTSTGFLQSEIDVLGNALQTSTGFLQSEIDACCNALKTSTGFLQSEIDTCCAALKTSTGFLQSEIDAIDSALRTSTGFLQSEVDACCNALKTSTGFLQSEIDTCCAALKTSTGFLQSEIDAIGSALRTSTGFLQSEIDACCNALKTSTGFLQSEIDTCCAALKTSTGFLQSEIDAIGSALRTSTGFLQSEIDACCNALKTSTGFLQSEIDTCCAALKTSTGFLQSEIDAIGSALRTSTGFLQSEIDACCAALKTSTGFLQSEIDIIGSALQTSTGFLQSEIDACCNALKTSTGFLQSEIDTCCAALKTSTGFLQSEIDTFGSALRTSTGFLQSEIDACCAALKTSTGFLQSEIDIIGSALQTSTGFLQSEIDACCAALMTSTGLLQSEIDAILCPVNCCDVHFVTDALLTNSIQSVDWSYDSQYLAIGLSNNGANGNPASDQVLQIYKLVGNSLVFVTSTALGTTLAEVSEVRWHPSMYRLAVGRRFIDASNPEPRLHIIDFNPVLNTLTQDSSADPVDVQALAWRQVPFGGNDLLAVGSSDIVGNNIALYNVDPVSGILTGPFSQVNPGNSVSPRAIDWSFDALNQYVAVGITAGVTPALRVYRLTAGPTLTFVTGIDVTLSSGTPTAQAVNWNPVYTNILAAGYAVDSTAAPTDQLVQTFNFNGSILTQTSGIAGIDLSVLALDWHPDGLCLAVGKEGQGTSTYEFAVYGFNNQTSVLASLPASEFTTTSSLAVEDVRWAPNGTYISNGSDDALASVYKNNCPQVTICDLISRVAALETCCEQLQTSTGFMQSEIDVFNACCISLESSLEVVESELDVVEECCIELQSEVEFILTLTFLEMSATILSKIDQLEECCATLQTSTGFLQSEIDSIENRVCEDEGCDACDVAFLTQDNSVTYSIATNNVATTDWSFDSRFVAIGLSNDNVLTTPNVLQIYELVGSSLILRAQTSFANLRDVGVIRWHPTMYRLAIGRIVAINGAGEPQLTIFDFDPSTYALTAKSFADYDVDVYALSWRPSPLNSSEDILAVGRNRFNRELAIYTVASDSSASLSRLVEVTSGPGTKVQLQAMDWDATSNFLAVGVQCESTQNTLQVFQFNPSAPSLILDSSTNVFTIESGIPVCHTVLALDWNKNIECETQNLLAVGLQIFPCTDITTTCTGSGPTSGELVQVFTHTPGNDTANSGSLTYQCGINDFDTSVNTLQWHPFGKCLAVGEDASVNCPIGHNGQFITYAFDHSSCLFTLEELFSDAGCVDIQTVRWAPNGQIISVGNDTDNVSTPGAITIYNNQCLTYEDLVSRIDMLEACCAQLQTSTGFLQSELDRLLPV